MNNSFSFGEYRWFTGLVINVNDPKKYGRVKVCVFGYNITTEAEFSYAIDYAKKNFDSTLDPDDPEHKEPNSYWASVVLPTTSAGMSGIGINHGLKPGSTVTGWFADGANAQQPIVNGVIAGNAVPLIIPQPPEEIKEPKDVGRTKIPEGKPADVKKLFAGPMKSDLNNIAINDNIDQSIIKWRSETATRSKTAYNVTNAIKAESKKITDAAFATGISALNNQLGGALGSKVQANMISSTISTLKTDVVGKMSASLAKSVNGALNPDAILKNTLRKINVDAKSAQAQDLQNTMKILKMDACFAKQFAEKLVTAIATKAIAKMIGVANEYIGGTFSSTIIGINGEVTTLLTSVKHLVDDVETTIAVTEARVLGTIANVVGGVTGLVYDLEEKMTAPIVKAVADASQAMAGEMDAILGKIATAEDAETVAKLMDDMNSLMTDANRIAGIMGDVQNILDTDFVGIIKDAEKQITGIPKDIIESYETALKGLNLTNLGC